MPRAEARRERLLPFRRAQAELRRVTERLAINVISGDTSVVGLYNLMPLYATSLKFGAGLLKTKLYLF